MSSRERRLLDKDIEIRKLQGELKHYKTCFFSCVFEKDRTRKALDVMALSTGELELDFIQLRSLFYYGLKKIQRDQIKSKEDAGNVMSDYLESEGNIEDLTNVMVNALVRSLGFKEGK